jgi:methyl-accepting chemotaxis protein
MSDTYTPRPDSRNLGGKDMTSQAKDLAGQAKDLVRDVKTKASGLTDEVTRAAKDNASQLGNAAMDMANTAKDKVEAAVSQRKSLGADYIGSLAQATGRAAHEFEAELPQAAHYIRQASEQMQGVADTVRQRDVRELVGEVQDFARRQPTLFFGGAVVLGFAALRFLKSTAPTTGNDQAQSNAFEQRREG